MAVLTALCAFLPLLQEPVPEKPAPPPQPWLEADVSFVSLLRELLDLDRLAQWPEIPYRSVQFSSYDRRSRTPEGWFSNSDGFGGEPLPGFEGVVREPGPDGRGEWLLCEVEGPGAIVRGWSAGMDGTLRVWLDGAEEPLWEGPGREFLARRTRHWLAATEGPEVDPAGLLEEEDADYLPIPFARSLRVTWEGRLEELHFYHLQLRLYPEGTKVHPFTLEEFARLRSGVRSVQELWQQAKRPLPLRRRANLDLSGEWGPGEGQAFPLEAPEGGGVIRRLQLRVLAEDLPRALRGLVLSLRFDGAERPQIEMPVGDFYAEQFLVAPYRSLPVEVHDDGRMEMRLPMPFAEEAEVRFDNVGEVPVQVVAFAWLEARPWNPERSLHLHGLWRQDLGLDLTREGTHPRDLDFGHVRGRGRLIGAASLLHNPTPVPSVAGDWWGEGDEKIWLDGDAFPAFFGTGSEDYYNYSWSRPWLFGGAFCGMPWNSGPGHAGYVTNFRWHVLDDLLFEEELRFAMELWHHYPVHPLSYARCLWFYAAPGAEVLDPPPLSGRTGECRFPPPVHEPLRGAGASAQAVFLDLRELLAATADDPGQPETRILEHPLAPRGELVLWEGRTGEEMILPLEFPEAGLWELHLVALHAPDAGAFQARLDYDSLVPDGPQLRPGLFGARPDTGLDQPAGDQVQNVDFRPLEVEAGRHELILRCARDGRIALDSLWMVRRDG